MTCACDQHAALGSQHLSRLVEHHLHDARILALLLGQAPGAGARPDGCELDDRALGLRDDRVRDRHDRARLRRRLGERVREDAAEVVARADLGDAGERSALKAGIAR